jgi:hypothetical protein
VGPDMKTLRPLPLSITLAAIVVTSGCRLAHDLLPRTHTTSTSPDGRYYAFVRQHLNVDPPDDHIYLGTAGRSARRIMSLAPDADWCRAILWTPDSRTVAFLINEQRLALFDTRTLSQIATVTLVDADGYPGSQEARDVSLANDGTVTFERVVRATMLLPVRSQGIIEAPVTWHGTYGRPIHRALRSLGRRQLRMALGERP